MDLKSEALRCLYRDWERWRGARLFPDRFDIDPLELRYILGNLSLTDVFYDPLRFFYRIHATSSAERLGFDLTHKSLDALPDQSVREILRQGLTQALEARAPILRSQERVMATKEFGFIEALILPFSRDGRTIDMLATGTHFDVPKYSVLRPFSPATPR